MIQKVECLFDALRIAQCHENLEFVIEPCSLPAVDFSDPTSPRCYDDFRMMRLQAGRRLSSNRR